MSPDLLKALHQLVIDLKGYLICQQYLGIREIPSPSPPASPLSPSALGDRRQAMAELKTRVLSCTRCRLHQSRTRVVFGEGNIEAELMFIGEAPGYDEDRQGRPFVGKAGQLLTRMIEAIKLKREEVYIANVIKCRPPANRNPEEDEIAHCEPYLRQQVALVQPKVICALGTFAAQTLLQTGEKISRLRGRFHSYQGIKVMPTYHPAFLLRNPEYKRAVWKDLQMIQRELRR
ncbi:MAG: uracil-DNA glycosylase [Nitrospinota bacterium]|nr:MAG: uracil-DNA glycosylase [Nitrospinota bacterium]